MEYRRLGNSDLEVSRLCMGTMTFGDQVDEAEAVRMVERAIEEGINFFDTADTYSAGRSEQILGRALRGRRDDVIVATKLFNAVGDVLPDTGLSREHITQAIDDSLRRLGTDRVDLYQLHQPDYGTPLEETLAAMDGLVREGKVRWVGVSNYAAWQVCRALWICERDDLSPIVSVQPRYSLITRDVEQELLPFCRDFGLGVMVYNPLAGGLLTGKHCRGEPPAEGTRFALKEAYRERFWHGPLFDAVQSVLEIADGAGLTPVELSLRWVLSRPQVTSLILGASRMEQLEDNLVACRRELPAGVADACEEVWGELKAPTPPYNR